MRLEARRGTANLKPAGVATDRNTMFGKGRRNSRVRPDDIALPPAVDEHPFTVVKHGWRMAEVAAFVADVSADMTHITPQDLRRATFTVDKRGYDKAEVIAYLNRVAAEIESELELERARVRRERLTNLDPTLAVEPRPSAEPPSPTSSPAAEPEAAAEYSYEVIEPAPRIEAGLRHEVIWVDVESLDAPDAAPPPAPFAPAEPPAPNMADASAQIAELLRAAHDTSIRLRDEAEADADRHRAHLIHDAEMSADEIRRQGEREAAATRAAAEAVMLQAQAEVAKIKAIANHNLAEIEAARHDAVAKGTELMSLGKGMLAALHDLDRDIAQRLIRTQQIVAMAQARARESAS